LATKPAPPRPVPRLYLATSEVDDPSALIASLPGLLAGADIAAVLVRLKPTDQRTMISRVKALAPAIQGGGAALLLDGHVELVARAGADGAHLTGIEAMAEALPSLKPDRIAGVGGLSTRHDSMARRSRRGLRAVRRTRCRGSQALGRGDRRAAGVVAELFEPPCVGYAASLDEAREFAAAGADFILVGEFIWADPRGAAAALKDAEQAIRQAHAAGSGKVKAEQDNAGNEYPASPIDPDKLSAVAGWRRGADLVDAAGRPGAASRPGAAGRDQATAKPKPKPPTAAKKPAPAATPKPAATPAPTATVTPAPVFEDPNVDLVYGAYQRGQYKTAFDLATNRAQFNGDPRR